MGIERNSIESEELGQKEISLKEIILIIKYWISFLISKWKIITLTGLISGIIALGISWSEKPIYKAILTFAMEEDKSGGGIGGALGLASSFGFDIGVSGGGAFAATNLSELMKSRLIVEKVLFEPVNINGQVTSLAEYYIEINKLRNSWLSKPSLQKIQFLPNSDRSRFSLQQDSIIQIIYRKLIDKESLAIIQKDKKISILTIEVKSEDELFSKLFCESLAKETSDFYIETKSKKARINADVLQKQVDSIRSKLDGAISGVAIETDNVYNLNPAFNIKGAASKKKQIDVQANTTILSNLVVQLELAKIALRKETPLIQLIDKPILPLAKEKFGKTKSLILGGFLGVVLSIFYFILSEYYRKVIK
jgi:hypothetical protein